MDTRSYLAALASHASNMINAEKTRKESWDERHGWPVEYVVHEKRITA